MKLQEAKKEASKESRAQPRKIIYVEVDEAGDCDITTHFQADSCLHAYKNGSEIAMSVAESVSKQGKTKNNLKEEVMAQKKEESKKSNGVEKKAAETKKPVKGEKKELTIKQIADLFKKGYTITTNTGAKYTQGYINKGLESKSENKRTVIVSK